MNNIAPQYKPFFEKSRNNIKKISDYLIEHRADETVYPPLPLIYTTFGLQPNDVKVILIGQDPYISPGQAMGLCFSVTKNTRVPPSLGNIFKELKADGFTLQDENCGDLSKWFEQGVFMINTALTVHQGVSNSHSELWKDFTRELMKYLNIHCSKFVIIAWGAHCICTSISI
jgi:uracil-DNA glycosylase